MVINNNARHNAFSTLLSIEKNKSFSAQAIDSVLEKSNMSGLDKSFFTRLVYGVLEKKLTLDFIIEQYSNRQMKTLTDIVQMLLRIGTYQIVYCDKIPDSAAVNETVNLCSKVSPAAKGFVNAVLRSICRNKDMIKYPDKLNGADEYLSLKYSVSKEICREFISDYGYRRTESILAGMENPNYTTIRVNTNLITRDELIDEFRKNEIYPRVCEYSDVGLKVTENITHLMRTFKGKFFVQDEASQIAVKALSAERGDTVIDVCACPGGKTFGAGMDMKNEGTIYAFDLHENKLSLIKNEAEALAIGIINTGCLDARKPDEKLFGKADKVICDLPCSGLGVMRKKPELRYKDLSETQSLPKIQYEILNASAYYLKRGGILVYSTCTMRKCENENNISEFLSNRPDFRLCPFSLDGMNCNGMITLAPDTHGTDGFFIAKLIKE